MSQHNYNYIIVGQGLAGTVLAHTLIQQGRSVLVIDNNDPHSSSRIAAGLFNPIVPKRLAKSWRVDELMPVMTEFYQKLEKDLDTRFFFFRRMIKPFSEEQEKVLWLKKARDDVGKFLSREFFEGDAGGLICNPIGAAEILSAGYLHVSEFLSQSRIYLENRKALLIGQFEYDDLEINANGVKYHGHSADKLIFCEGASGKNNPWFAWADYRLTKGEIIGVSLPEGKQLPPDLIINKGVFIVQTRKDRNQYKVGATFEWDNLTNEPTEKARRELVEKLHKILKVPFEIIGQQAAIRPTMNDRRPVIGLHPGYPVLGIFNGLGTKGVMIAPYFARHFLGFLERGFQLDPEVDIRRFWHNS
jgi:glycine/D-amino acid oxidase-like deaminating enzyme